MNTTLTEAERESLRPFLAELYEMACAFAMVEDGKVTVGTGAEQRTMTIARMERRLLGLARILESRLQSWSILGTTLRVNDRLLLIPEARYWLRANPNLGYEWYLNEDGDRVLVAPQADIYKVPGQILVSRPNGALVNFPVAIAEAMREAYLKRGTP